ncbi:MAG TPA: 6-phosphogluconolactonase [Acidobacteriota bacterium]|nr:6-phosphogluconolactonase [Acidobacteriota bacterium]
MPRPAVEIYQTADALNGAAAERIVDILEGVLREGDKATFVLTGGNTPRRTYELLAEPALHERLDWDRIHFFWGDERCVPPEDPASNFGMAWRAFLSKLPIPSGNIHRILGELEDPGNAALRYEEEIRCILTDGFPPAFDLILLGMGEDGHTASLFPGTAWNKERLVVANFVPKLKATRITMTPHLLNAGRTVIFLTAGAAKSKILAEVLENPAADYPAKRIQPHTGNLTWMIDGAAAALLRSGLQQNKSARNHTDSSKYK